MQGVEVTFSYTDCDALKHWCVCVKGVSTL
jgi:hypothetical protein